jgi:hypothetical protein
MSFKLRITNFRNLRNIEINNPEPISYFTGENEAGKSSLGAAIEFVFTNSALGVKGVDNRLLVTDNAPDGLSVEMDVPGLHLKRTLSSGTPQKTIASMLGTDSKVLPLMFPHSLDVAKGSSSIKAYLNTLQEVTYDFNDLVTIMPEFKPFYDEAVADGIAPSFKALIEHAEGKRAASKYEGVSEAPDVTRPTAEEVKAAQDRVTSLNENLTRLRDELGTSQREIAALEADLSKTEAAPSAEPVKPKKANPGQADIDKLNARIETLRGQERQILGDLEFKRGRVETLTNACAEIEKTLKKVTDAPVKPEQARPTAKALADAQTAIQAKLTDKIRAEGDLTPIQARQKLLQEVAAHQEALKSHAEATEKHAEKAKDPLKERRAVLQGFDKLTGEEVTRLAKLLRESQLTGFLTDAVALEAFAARLPAYQGEALEVLANNPLPGKAPIAPVPTADVAQYMSQNPKAEVSSALEVLAESLKAKTEALTLVTTAHQEAVTAETELKKTGKAWTDYDAKHTAYQATVKLGADRKEIERINGEITGQQTKNKETGENITKAEQGLTDIAAVQAEWTKYESENQVYQRAQASSELRKTTEQQLVVKRATRDEVQARIATAENALGNANTDRDQAIRVQERWQTYDSSQEQIQTKAKEAQVEWDKWDGWSKKLHSEERSHNNTRAASFAETLNQFAKNSLGDRKIEIGETEFLVGGRPARLLSGSTQWRLTACVSAAVAKSINSPILVLDGADVLDRNKRKALMNFIAKDLAPDFKHVVVTGTCLDDSKEVEFPPGCGIKKFLLKDGALAPLLPYVAPAAKAPALAPVPSLGKVVGGSTPGKTEELVAAKR